MKKWDEQERQDRLADTSRGQKARQMGRMLEPPRDHGKPKRTARGHRHVEAFCLMVYACAGQMREPVRLPGRPPQFTRTAGCGHREVFWNSRDGVTPFAMGCPSCGGDLQHVDWHLDTYSPNHKPHHGQGVWRDGTAEDAERIMRYRLTFYPPEDKAAEERIEALIARIREGKEEAGEFQKGWPMFARWDALKSADER